jgi:hypothetical protein
MKISWVKIKRTLWLAIILIAAGLLLQRSDIETGDLFQQVRGYTREQEFDFDRWGIQAMGLKLTHIGLAAGDYLSEETQKQLVLEYLDLIRQIQQIENELYQIYTDPNTVDPEGASTEIRQTLDDLYQQRDQLAPLAEAILQKQINSIVAEMDLSLGGQAFPPVLYHVTPLPLALIVSPREVIRQDIDISLIPDLTVADRTVLEEQVDGELDVSSLVVNVGGIGMYPTMVMQTTNINWLAEIVAHEWIHNYLTIRPLGASYLSSPELRIINETVASMAGKEIGTALIERYYPEFAPPPSEPQDPAESKAPTPAPEPPVFDFNAEMNETRVTVDEMLAAGEIEEAEAYMESRRLFFWENGYRIRKLNQAYFAFYGAYADTPGGSSGAAEDPIGDAVRQLRAQSGSLADFINRVSWIWTLEQLLDLVAQPQ